MPKRSKVAGPVIQTNKGIVTFGRLLMKLIQIMVAYKLYKKPIEQTMSPKLRAHLPKAWLRRRHPFLRFQLASPGRVAALGRDRTSNRPPGPYGDAEGASPARKTIKLPIYISFDPKLLMRPPAEVLDVGVTVAQAAPALEHCAKAQDGGLVQPLGDELNADR
jgi:hypothetical protein